MSASEMVTLRVDPAEHYWYLAILSLLSIPGHSNLVIMQDLIEQFTPQLARENSLAYFGLPREIYQMTEVVHWNAIGAGYSIYAPVRAIFLLKLRIEQPEMYYAVHRFLARTNWQWAADLSGADQVRYLREYLYHSVSSEDPAAQFLLTTVQEIAEKFPDYLMTLLEEIAQDDEFKVLLSSHPGNIRVTCAAKYCHRTDYMSEG